MIDITHDYLKIVLAVLVQYAPKYEVWAFGSRVGGKTKKHADLDLVIKTDLPVPDGIMANLREAFSESNLPFKVDVVDWSKISKNFQKIIKEKFEVIQKCEP
ncbi:MAG: nucleotidyltransferase domain-containing protein [Pseudomonadota bacterium]